MTLLIGGALIVGSFFVNRMLDSADDAQDDAMSMHDDYMDQVDETNDLTMTLADRNGSLNQDATQKVFYVTILGLGVYLFLFGDKDKEEGVAA